MRQLGLIVDDVSKEHKKEQDGTPGTQTIYFKDKTELALDVRATLMTFSVSKPTLQEYAKLPVYDIALPNWNPQQYYDDPSRR